MSELMIRRLTPGLVDDYLGFFDHDAFCDNPDWAGCYCYWYHFPGTLDEWNSRTGEANRADVAGLIRQGRQQGYLAYQGDRVVGWCSAMPRVLVPNVGRFSGFSPPDEPLVGSITCYVVAAPFRRQGVATSLLRTACDGFRDQGLSFAEAYPSRQAATDAKNYHGPLAMYLEAGFVPVHETDDLVVVRKRL